MQTNNPAISPEKSDKELLWTKCWRKIYAEEAKKFGYTCRWAGGELLLSKNGYRVAYIKPETKAFTMRRLIEAAEKQVEERKAKETERKALQNPKQAGTPRMRGRIGGFGQTLPLLMAASALTYFPAHSTKNIPKL